MSIPATQKPTTLQVENTTAKDQRLDVASLEGLAQRWNVSPAVVTSLGAKRVGNDWHFPERDADGEVIGTARRFDDGKKGFVSGGHRGLTLKWPLDAYAGSTADDPILVVEGQSDTATGIELGFDTVGRPSACGGLDHLKALLAERHVAIVAENDDAGQQGALKIAKGLLDVCTSVRIVSPPDGAKDLREWHSAPAGCSREELQASFRAVEPLSIRSFPLEGDLAGIEFIPASALGEGDQTDWIWTGWLARGFVTLLVGLWKAGKSTLLAHILNATEDGGNVAGTVSPVRVLVVTEEGKGLWANRREEIGIADNCEFVVRPFKGRPTEKAWRSFLRVIADAVKDGQFDIVVFDTWQTMTPCPDENDAAKMMAALTPLHEITEAGAAVLLIHHPRKSEGSQGQASRGSGALPGFVDIIVELRRHDPTRQDDTRRKLTGLSRFDETPKEVVLELRDDGYHTLGDALEAQRLDCMSVVDSMLTEVEKPLTVEAVRDNWQDSSGPKPGLRSLRDLLNKGAKAERWIRTGEGKKGSPYLYSKCDSGKAQV